MLGYLGVRASWMHYASLSEPAGNGLLARSVAACQPKEHMKNFRSIVDLLAAIALVSSVPALAAGVAADVAQVATQAAPIPALKQSAANAAGYKATDLEVKSTAHQITITVANSKLSASLPAGRTNEAAKIMQGFESTRPSIRC